MYSKKKLKQNLKYDIEEQFYNKFGKKNEEKS